MLLLVVVKIAMLSVSTTGFTVDFHSL